MLCIHVVGEQMGGNDAVLSQLLKMAENIKKGQTGFPTEGHTEEVSAVTETSPTQSDEEPDFARQEEEVLRMVHEEELRRLDNAVARERAKLKRIEARIRRAEKKLRHKRASASAATHATTG